jgi:uncharacterized MAPEG superfamily protein
MTAAQWSLFAAVVLGIVHISADSFTFKAQVGNRYTIGPRDLPVERTGVAGRLHRAARNYTENVVLFAVVAYLLHTTGTSGAAGLYGAWTWVGARAAYLIAYASGIPWGRTVCWQVAMVGLVAMMVDLFV